MKAFDCKICGACCYGEGGIVVEDDELKKIAHFLRISRDAMISGYCEERHGKRYITTGTDRY